MSGPGLAGVSPPAPAPREHVIRRASPADAPEVWRLVRELAVYERLADSVRSSEESFRASLAAAEPALRVFLAETDGRAVGVALAFLTFSTFEGAPTLYLEDIFVEPSARGSGIGRALLRRLAQEARDLGCRRMEWVVLDWNTSARRFYDALGARAMDGWIVYRLDAEAIDRVVDTGVEA